MFYYQLNNYKHRYVFLVVMATRPLCARRLWYHIMWFHLQVDNRIHTLEIEINSLSENDRKQGKTTQRKKLKGKQFPQMDTGKQIIQKVSRHSSSLGCPIDANASCFWYAMNDKRDDCIVKTTNWPCETDAGLLTVAFEVTK